MLTPQITLKDVAGSAVLETLIKKKVTKLNQYYDRIQNCRVVIESTQRHKHRGKLYNVRIEVTVPGRKQLVSTHNENEDVYVAIRDGFDAMSRQLEEHGRRRNGQVKVHAEAVPGEVVRLMKDEGYGFIKGVDGTECYFSVTNVRHPTFDQLVVGDTVLYTPEALSDGWQAHHITKGKQHHLDETY